MAKILIIEDESSLLEVYSEALVSEGHVIISASDGEEGLKKALEEDWVVLFLDIMLPSMDGLTILKRLKEADVLKDRFVILLSNLDNPNVVSEALRLGAVESLSKADITPDVILNTVEKYVLESKQ